jgi:hypothetical protein
MNTNSHQSTPIEQRADTPFEPDLEPASAAQVTGGKGKGKPGRGVLR